MGKRQTNRLTSVAVNAKKTPGYYADGNGLYLQVSESLSKSWIFRYSLNKRAREMGLGSTADRTLAEARAQRDQFRKLFKEWMRDKIEQHRGNHAAVWETYKDAGYLMTECVPVLLYLVHDRGGDQTNFVQLKVYEDHEFISRYLFNGAPWGKPFSAHRMLEGTEAGEVVERREIGHGWYRFWSAVDMANFVPEAACLFEAERDRHGKRVLEMSNPHSNAVVRTTFSELYPEHSKYPWKGTRLFQDWEASSTGRSGARICRHWVFDTYDYQRDQHSKRNMSYIPQWGFNRPLAKVDKPGKNIYELFGKLQRLDQRVGVPFSWYFYMLHGNRVEDWVGARVIKAAEQGLLVLPECDYRVLKRWEDQPYGF